MRERRPLFGYGLQRSGMSAVYHSVCEMADFWIRFDTLWHSCGISTRQWKGYMIILFWSTTGWYCCPVYYSLQITWLGDCSLKCGLAQSIASYTLWNTKMNGHYRHVFILFKHDMLWRPQIKVRWVDHTPCPYLNADVVAVSLPT